ncbi:MAG TPA: DUF1922 domain-containing protein, partial [Candidatus Dormibacteraeota bacterium]|nr:DUF1922 domain-containing protein [Candidatus Dormibacteraeota bacterium]
MIARQTRYGGGFRGGHSEPLPVDLFASAAFAPIANTIGGWARIATEETRRRPCWRAMAGPLCPPTGVRCGHDSCAALRRTTTPPAVALEAAWLAQQIGWLRLHPAAAEAFRELHHACEQLRELCDLPGTRGDRLVGMCDCGRILYAPHGRDVVQCRASNCGATWNVTESQAILRKNLDDRLVTPGEAAHLGGYLDTDRSQKQIRALVDAWARRGQITARGEIPGEPDEKGEPTWVPTYRFGDIAERMAVTP